jgi:DNA primase
MPPMIVSLKDMPPTSPPVDYLQKRRFGQEAWERYEISFCLADCEHPTISNRIVYPIFQDGALAGWQARAIYPNIEPKYFTSTGMQKSKLLYNLDRARSQPFLILVEGVTDVWRIGDHAVALLGHDLSPTQKNLLCQACGTSRPVLVLLDPEERERSSAVEAELRQMRVPAPTGSAKSFTST